MNQEQMTVYFDGSCPLCRIEIEHYRKQDSAKRLSFQDASPESAELGPDLMRSQAMARFHVRRPNGELLSGATAFVAIWQLLPGWRWAARIGKVPSITLMLEVAYRAFLPLRPGLARLVRYIGTVKPDHPRPSKKEKL